MTDWSCPILTDGPGDRVLLAHGEGGRAMRRLLRERVLPRLRVADSEMRGPAPRLDLGDAAVVAGIVEPIVVTTDSFVVSPLFFPGGDIGTLAVYGAVNDLAVSGAEPFWLSLSLILEEGLPLAVLDLVLDSVAAAARRTRVAVVAGDTKVVPRGAADGLFLTTTGIGRQLAPALAGPAAIRPGDAILVSGPVGRHGVAILAAREKLGFDPPPQSDCAPLFDAVSTLRTAGIPVRCLRDATRGGVTAVLHEFAEACGHSLVVDEAALPVTDDVRAACELLGLEPLQMANEGTFVAIVPSDAAGAAVAALRRVPESAGAAAIGHVRANEGTPVIIRRRLGNEQALDEPSGAPLPRIC